MCWWNAFNLICGSNCRSDLIWISWTVVWSLLVKHALSDLLTTYEAELDERLVQFWLCSANIRTDREYIWYSMIMIMIIIFPGGYHPMLYIFGKLSLSQYYVPFWHVMLQLTVFKIFAIEILDFGATWGYPKREKTIRDPHLPPCRISCRSVAPPPRYPSPHKKCTKSPKLNIRQNSYKPDNKVL